MILSVIRIKRICNAVECELRTLDTVAVSSYKSALECGIGKNALKRIKSAHYINTVALKNSDDTAEVQYLCLHSSVFESILVHLSTVGHFSEKLFVHNSCPHKFIYFLIKHKKTGCRSSRIRPLSAMFFTLYYYIRKKPHLRV